MTMKNVTITLDEKVAHWARVEAAKAGKSLSRWIGERLGHEMIAEQNGAGVEKWLDSPLWPSQPTRIPTRAEYYEDLYDRPGFRRHERDDLFQGPKGAGKSSDRQRLAKGAER
jgi:hypothetical protein